MIEVVVDEEAFRSAGPLQRRRLRSLARRLAAEPFLGDRIRRRQVPRRFAAHQNLFRLALPEGWRALYTVDTLESKGMKVWIVWAGDHTAYDRLFGYR